MCSMSSQTAKKNTEVNRDIIEKLQAMGELYAKTNGKEQTGRNIDRMRFVYLWNQINGERIHIKKQLQQYVVVHIESILMK